MSPLDPTRRILAMVIALLAALTPSAADAKRVALIIANAKYEHIGALTNPASDAALVEATLRKAGFAPADITVARDVGFEAMRRAILAFKRKAGEADTAVIYFAGHGIGAGENFLIPVDAQLTSYREISDEAFSQRAFEDAVNVASGLKLVILDACRNDPTRGRMTGLPATRAVDRGLRQAEPDGGVVVWYAAKHGTVAQDGPAGGNSPFAMALSQHLPTPGRDIRFVFGAMRDAVITATDGEQEPFIYGSLGGREVYLVPPEPPTGPRPLDPSDMARRDWDIVKDSDNIALLEAFRKQHGEHAPFHAHLALERIRQLEQRRASVDAAPPPRDDTVGVTPGKPAAQTPLIYENKALGLVRTFAGHSDQVNAVAFSPDGRLALSGSSDNTMKLWEVVTGNQPRGFVGHSGSVFSVAFSPDGRRALSGSWDKTLKLWDIGTGQTLRDIVGHSEDVLSVALSPDGRLALSGAREKTIRLWDVTTGQPVRAIAVHSALVRSIAFAPNGRFALSGSADKTLKLWEVGTGKVSRTFAGHSDSVNSVAISPDGRLCLSGDYKGTLKLWDMNTGKALRTLKGHTNAITSVALSPDGRLALSGSGDNTMKLWDLAKGQALYSVSRHGGSVMSVAFSPDGRFALSGGADKTLKLWDISEWTASSLTSAR